MELTLIDKQRISAELRKFSEEKNMSYNEIARRSGLSTANLSQVANQKDIKDHWYLRVADYIGINLRKDYWPLVHTPQFLAIVNHLEDSRRDGKNRILIGETGCGKTYTVNEYRRRKPSSTFIITVSMAHNLGDILQEIANEIGVDLLGTRVSHIRDIARRLQWFQMNDMSPLLIIDEAENMKIGVYGMLKSLYDQLNGICPIVLMGTDQIISRMEILRKKNRVGIPQFYRRFKAGIRHLPPINRRYNEFLSDVDPKLSAFLSKICDNYGELYDYLEYALREADRQGHKLDLPFFKDLYNLKSDPV